MGSQKRHYLATKTATVVTKRKRKNSSRVTKDKEKGIKALHCQKSSNHRGRQKERNKGTLKSSQNNEQNGNSKTLCMYVCILSCFSHVPLFVIL